MRDYKEHTHQYDIVLDCAGINTLSKNTALLKKSGRLLLIAADLPTIIFAPVLSKINNIKIIAGPQSENVENLETILAMANKEVLKPVIDTIFTIDEAKEAHAFVQSKRKKGNVLIKF